MQRRITILNIVCILLILLFYSTTSDLFAQSRSRIIGTVKDSQTKETLIGVSVVVKTTYLGASTDINGKFFIVNVPVGTFDLQVSMIGYKTQQLKNIMVSADRVTTLEISLDPTTLQGEEVVITAKKDELHKEVSNTQMVVTSDQLKETSGIRQINAFLEKLPGVSTENGFLTIRGGSSDQTGAMVNGFSYNNAAVGNAETSVPLSAIDQVSLLSGGYNAEYGNFRSGLINITTKSGSKEKYQGTFSLSKDQNHLRRFGDSFFSPYNSYLSQYLNPNIAFDPSATFNGWQNAAATYNKTHATAPATPMDMFLLAHWMFTAVPDYAALDRLPDDLKQKIGYQQVSDEQKRLFADHARVETGADFNFDGGFGGPIPFIGKALGDATFYLSNTSMEQHYIMPVTLESQKSYTTLGTIKSMPLENLSFTYNILWKRQLGVSPVRPAFGDAPDASNAGGFMPVNNIKYIYQAYESSTPTPDRAYWYDQPFYPLLDQTTLMNGISINHVLSPRTFWQFTLSYLTIKDHTPTGDNRDTSFVTAFGPFMVNEMPYGKLQFATSNTVQGYKWAANDNVFGTQQRFRSKEGDLYDNSLVQQLAAKLEVASQVDDHNYVKGGVEYNYIHLKHDYWEKWNNNSYNTYEFNYDRTPSQTGFYLQDQITFGEIVANIGLRGDYYYSGGGKWPSNDSLYSAQFIAPIKALNNDSLYTLLASGTSGIWKQWNEWDALHPGFLQPIKNYFTLSPRIGVSFPITVNSKFYFNYGHFRSNPPYYTMYQLRYRYTKNGIYNMTDPNLEPPKTVQYELGMAYNFYDNYILTVSGYYKDVTGEPGSITYINKSGQLNYKKQASIQFEDVQGLELNLTKNDNSWINGWVNFNYMLKKSGSLGLNQIQEGQVEFLDNNFNHPSNRALPLPTVNANITFKTPTNFGPEFLGTNILGGWNISVFASYKAGSYFDPSDWNPLNLKYVSELLEWPDYYMVDLKVSKSFEIAGLHASVFFDVSNILNIKVNQMSSGYPFAGSIPGADFNNYMSSLHLLMYDSPLYDQLRTQFPGSYIAGNDKAGDLKSDSKPYINNPDNDFFLFGKPIDIWFGFRVDF